MMKDEKNKSKKETKSRPDERGYQPKRPDYRGNRAAVWLNEKNGRKWLRIRSKVWTRISLHLRINHLGVNRNGRG